MILYSLTQLKDASKSLVVWQDRGDLGPFDDEETRSFYSFLPDLHALVPSILLTKGQGKEGKDEEAGDLDEEEASPPIVDGTTDEGEN